MKRIITIVAPILLFVGLSLASNPTKATLPQPEVNKDSWVMIEIWPLAQDITYITFAAYFLDFSYEKNRNLCDAAKKVFDRDQEVQSKERGKPFTSYRLCMSVNDARSQGYIQSEP